MDVTAWGVVSGLTFCLIVVVMHVQPQSAGAIPHVNGTPVRRLFHSIDDEGYHVPTHVSF